MASFDADLDSVDQFTTDRLTAERLRASHLPSLLAMDADPRIMDNIGGVRSEAETRLYLANNLAHWTNHGFGLWMLSLRENKTLVGRAALRRMMHAGNEENTIGYALMPEFWRRGLATEIVTAILRLAFRRLGMKDAVAGALPDNGASRRVMEKTGGVHECDTYYKGAPHVLYRFRPDLRDLLT